MAIEIFSLFIKVYGGNMRCSMVAGGFETRPYEKSSVIDKVKANTKCVT